jgi:hypothetical protein
LRRPRSRAVVEGIAVKLLGLCAAVEQYHWRAPIARFLIIANPIHRQRRRDARTFICYTARDGGKL